MKKIAAKPRPILTPQMVQMIATYNEDGSVDLMNAAWGGQLDFDLLVLSLDKTHKTVANLRKTNAFTLGFPNCKDLADCDYVGLVSGNDFPDKFQKTDLHASKSSSVNAPVIDEFPITFECEVFKTIDDEELGFYVLAKVVDILYNEDVLDEKGQPDVAKMDLCFFSPLDNTYRRYGEVAEKAFSCGLKKKGK